MQDPIIQTKICGHCGSSFDITQGDLDFYDKISPTFAGQKFQIPTPTLCPDCRQRRRLSFRNERKLYRRICDATQQPIISIYSPDKPYKVYDQKMRRSDSRDAMDYGFEFDFGKSFTENFRNLSLQVPRFSLQNGDNRRNADYTNGGDYEYDCYMIFNACYLENCLYAAKLYRSQNCVDIYGGFDCQYCYECSDIYNCFNCFYSINLKDCSDCYGCVNCIGCQYCIECSGLHSAQYHYQNTYIGKDRYEEIIKKQTYSYSSDPVVISNENCEFCDGLFLKNCNNVHISQEIEDGENLKYCFKLSNAQNCYDYDVRGDQAEWFYECQSAGWGGYHNMFVNVTWQGRDNLYCDNCVEGCTSCFGCVGLKGKSYCIFNKQYTKEEYETQVAKIIQHMQNPPVSDHPLSQGGSEWGEFFHPSLSPFGYNETVAQEYYPLHAVGASLASSDNGQDKSGPYVNFAEFGYHRSSYEAPAPHSDKVIEGQNLPNTIAEVEDSILQYAIKCEVTGKLFRIQAQELAFYRKYNIPLPRKHPDQRHLERLALRK